MDPSDAQETDREREHHARVRWLFTLLYLGGLRITEVGENTMGRFFSRRDANGEDRWWLEVLGKGGKERLVPATTDMMAELGAYRRARGLAALRGRTKIHPSCHRLASRASRSRVPRCIASSRRSSAAQRTRCEPAATNMRSARLSLSRPQRTGCGTAQGRIWRTSRSICGSCATISDMRRSRPPASTCMSTMTGAIARPTISTASRGDKTQ